MPSPPPPSPPPFLPPLSPPPPPSPLPSLPPPPPPSPPPSPPPPSPSPSPPPSPLPLPPPPSPPPPPPPFPPPPSPPPSPPPPPPSPPGRPPLPPPPPTCANENTTPSANSYITIQKGQIQEQPHQVECVSHSTCDVGRINNEVDGGFPGDAVACAAKCVGHSSHLSQHWPDYCSCWQLNDFAAQWNKGDFTKWKFKPDGVPFGQYKQWPPGICPGRARAIDFCCLVSTFTSVSQQTEDQELCPGCMSLAQNGSWCEALQDCTPEQCNDAFNTSVNAKHLKLLKQDCGIDVDDSPPGTLWYILVPIMIVIGIGIVWIIARRYNMCNISIVDVSTSSTDP